MKSLTVVCLLVVSAVCARPATYTDRYDNIDLDSLIGNRRMLIPYIKCVLDLGKCSPDGKVLKDNIQEALEQDCAKCTEKQRIGARKVFEHLVNHEKDYWNQLVAKYDPTHKYTRKYERELSAIRRG